MRSRPNCRRARASRRSTSGARASTDSAAVRVSISSASVSNQVVIDRDARAVVYQVIDTRTSQVVKQFPEEAVLRRRAYFHALDLTKDAPTRLRATDRRPEPSLRWNRTR